MSDRDDFDNLPVTQKILESTRSELKSLLAELEVNLKTDIKQLDAKIDDTKNELKGYIKSLKSELKGDIEGLRTELKCEMNGLRIELKTELESHRIITNAKMDEGFGELKAMIEKQNSVVHRNQTLFEQMFQQNKLMLDAITSQNDRIEKLERAVFPQQSV